jgi:RNA polymerase sigma factor for flagellar operon FliA
MHRAYTLYRSQENDEEALILQHAPLIERMARRVASRIGSFNMADDLWSAGALGLLDAAKRFDHSRGANFETFAQHRIRGAMLDELRRLDHLPRRLRAEAAAAAKAREALSKELERPATDEEVAGRLEIEPEALRQIEGVSRPPSPLLPEMLKSLLTDSVEDEAQVAETRRALSAAVAQLPERLQLVLSLHYVDDLTYQEIATVLGVSQPRVSQLHGDAIRKLREALQGSDL